MKKKNGTRNEILLKSAINSDESDVESLAVSLVGGDNSTEDDEFSNFSISIDTFPQQVDDAQNKRVTTRTKAAGNIYILMKRDYIGDVLEKWKVTLCEIIEKMLKKNVDELLRGCTMACLLSLQLGILIEDSVQGIIATLRSICADEAAEENVRSAAARTLGLCVYLCSEQTATKLEALQTLKTLWTSMRPSSASVILFTSALLSWVLILERLGTNVISSNITELVQRKLCNFLESPSVDVRIAAGEALAVIYDIAIDNVDEEFRFVNHHHLKDLFGDLSVDSSKYHAKRDKKAQKLTFRQISDVIFNNRTLDIRINFNKSETLKIDGCHSKLLYDFLRQILTGALNLHLTKNELLRDLFNLGPVIERSNLLLTKEEKTERKNYFDATDKARNILRGKQRDKKAH